MNPAHPLASNAHLPIAHVHAPVDVQPGAPEDVYAEAKPKGPQVALTDKSLITFTTGNVAVVPQRLLPVDARYGLAEVPGLKRLGVPHPNVANATLLPRGGVGGGAIVFGAPGTHTTKEPLAAERMARLAAVLTDNQVAHVMYVKHNSTSSSLELPVGQSVAVKAQGGPLNVSLIPAKMSSTTAPDAFYFQTTLPSGRSEQSADIGLWSVNLSEASPAQLHQTLKELHQAAGDQTVAFGCQSGTTRSGAVALLYHPRQLAEKLFQQGRHPSAEELTQMATDWGAICKEVRANEFAERMPPNMLKEHAALLADEMRQRPLEAPRMPAPMVQPKPAATTARVLNLTTRPPATPPKPQGIQSPHSAAACSAEPPPVAPRSKGSDSSDTDSVFSGVSDLSINSDSTFGSGIAAARPTPAPRRTSPPLPAARPAPSSEGSDTSRAATDSEFSRLHEKAKVEARASHPYGVGVELAPLLPKRSPPPSDLYSLASHVQGTAPESVYSDIDDTYARIRGEGTSSRAADTSQAHQFRLHARQSIRRMRETGMAAFHRPVELHIDSHPSQVTSARLQAWQTGQHERYEDLMQYLDGAGTTFAARADQGLRLFASKDTYGIGLTLANLKNQAHSAVWSKLAQALEQTIDEAPQGMTNMTDSILTVIMKERLKSQFMQMDAKQKDTWLRRTDKKEFSTAVQTLEQEMTSLSEQVEQDQQDHSLLATQLRSANLRLLTMKALHAVGTDPTLRR